MTIRKIFHKSTIAFAMTAVLYAQPASAGYVDWASFTQFQTQEYQVFKNNALRELSNLYNNIQNAFQTLGKTIHDNFQEYNKLGQTSISEYSRLINTVNQPPAQLINSSDLAGANVSGSIQNAQNAPGRIYLNDVIADMNSFRSVHNPTEAIVMASMINLRNRAKDSINVISYLDSTAKDYACKSTGYRCTTLIALQEKVAGQVDSLQKANVERGAYWLSYARRSHPEDIQYDNIFYTGVQGETVDINKDPTKLAAFLSPAPMLPAGFNPATDKGALTPQRATVLSDVLLGINNFGSLENFQKDEADPNRALLQSKILTKFARIQLARHAISSVTSLDVTDAMNAEFKMCVVRPTQEDTVGSSVEQHLTNVEHLMRCTNLSLLHLRRVQMEQSRLIGVLLATQLDQMTFTTSSEESSAATARSNN